MGKWEGRLAEATRGVTLPRVKLSTGGKVLLWMLQFYLIGLLALILVRFLRLF